MKALNSDAALDIHNGIKNCVSSMLATVKLEQLINGVVTQWMQNEARSVQMQESFAVLQGVLPHSTCLLIKHSDTLTSLKLVSDKVRNGDSCGAVELGTLLTATDLLKHQAPRLFNEPTQTKYANISHAFIKSIKQFVEKIKHTDDMLKKFHSKFDSLNEAVERWDFNGCPWIHAASCPEDEAIAKFIQQCVSQVQLWSNQCSAFDGFALDAWFKQSGDLVLLSELQPCFSSMKTMPERVHAAALLLASSLVAVSLLGKAAGNPTESFASMPQTLEFCSKKLQVSRTQFAQNLKDKVDALVPAVKAAPAPKSQAGSIATRIRTRQS